MQVRITISKQNYMIIFNNFYIYYTYIFTLILLGSAPGNHIPYLVDLFPEHKFILVDPNPFSIEETDRIKIVNGYFTDEMC